MFLPHNHDLAPENIVLADINHREFLKEVNITCRSIESFPSFYEELCTQGLNYNIPLQPIEHVSKKMVRVPD